MTGRRALAALLAVVALAAAVLSFSALRDLALVCGFDARLAWLLPVVVDAGAAAGSLVWLGAWAPGPARRFARVLALLLLGGSVAGNALGHGLAAFGLAAPWWVVVAVSAVAPAVLGAVVHLAVLASGRDPRAEADPVDEQVVPTERPASSPGRTGPDRAGPVTDEQVLADLRELPGRLPTGNELRRTYGMGSGRADRLLRKAAAERAQPEDADQVEAERPELASAVNGAVR